MVGSVFDWLFDEGTLGVVVVLLEGLDQSCAAFVDDERGWAALGGLEAGADQVVAFGHGHSACLGGEPSIMKELDVAAAGLVVAGFAGGVGPDP